MRRATSPREQALLGVLSLMFWSLLLVVTLKYVVLMMRADNEGEGGILSLFALVQRRLDQALRWGQWVVALAVLGAALFYCDALITPAISVLGAVEGLELLSPAAHHAIVPVTLVIIVAAVHNPASWHGPDGAPVWPDHDPVVRHAGGYRRGIDLEQPDSAAGGESLVRPGAAGTRTRQSL